VSRVEDVNHRGIPERRVSNALLTVLNSFIFKLMVYGRGYELHTSNLNGNVAWNVCTIYNGYARNTQDVLKWRVLV